MTPAERMIMLSVAPSVFSILTEAPTEIRRDTGFLFLNAGLVHRPGPYRLHVELCRALALAGYNCIRLDQSGRGDSERRPDMDLLDATILDVDAAIAELRAAGSTRIVMGGLCAAADDAIFIAPHREDIAGLIFLDGYVARTWRYYLSKYLRLASRITPARVMKRLRPAKKTASASDNVDETLQNIRNFPSPTEGRELFRGFIERNQRVLSIFTADVDEMYNYHGQLRDFVGHPKYDDVITEHFLPAGKHVYPFVAQRRWLINTLLEWVADIEQA